MGVCYFELSFLCFCSMLFVHVFVCALLKFWLYRLRLCVVCFSLFVFSLLDFMSALFLNFYTFPSLGYPSAIQRLCVEQLAGRLNIHPLVINSVCFIFIFSTKQSKLKLYLFVCIRARCFSLLSCVPSSRFSCASSISTYFLSNSTSLYFPFYCFGPFFCFLVG